MLDFTKSLAELASRQQNLQEDKGEKRLRDTLKNTCLQSMISLHVQFEPKQVIQNGVYLVSLFTLVFKKQVTVGYIRFWVKIYD